MINEALANHDVREIRRFQRRTMQPDLSHLPGDNGWPILGHTFHFLAKLHEHMNNQYRRHGPIFVSKTMLLDSVFLLGPDANRLVFKNEGKQFSNFLAWNNTFANLFDNNILERDFTSHKTHRKVLQAAF